MADDSFSPPPSRFREIAETTAESLSVEFKRWLDLSSREVQANLARHICALTNFGGGYVVFGREDDGSLSADEVSKEGYDHDGINAIADRYLMGCPHLEIEEVSISSGSMLTVLRVPSHGPQPVCAKRNGPANAKGTPQGIRQGTHYIRTPGPKSEPITDPALWTPLIRRCVTLEKGDLLRSINALLSGQSTERESSDLIELIASNLKNWHALDFSSWPNDTHSFSAFAFRLLDQNGQACAPIVLDQLHKGIQAASADAADIVNDGSAMFQIGWRENTRPKVTVIDDLEAYYCTIVPSVDNLHVTPFSWSIDQTGKGIEIVAFYEDSDWLKGAVEQNSSRKWPVGEKLAPLFQVRKIAQFLVFLGKFAGNFLDATHFEVAIRYSGLENRVIDDPRSGVYFSIDRSSGTNGRDQQVSGAIEELSTNLTGLTASLSGGIFRLFDGWDIGEEAVENYLAVR